MSQLLKGLDYLQHFISSFSHSQLEVVTGSKNWRIHLTSHYATPFQSFAEFQTKTDTINNKRNAYPELQPRLLHVISLVTLDQRKGKAKVKKNQKTKKKTKNQNKNNLELQSLFVCGFWVFF